MVKDVHHVAQARTHRVEDLTRRGNCLSFNEVLIQGEPRDRCIVSARTRREQGHVSVRTHDVSACSLRCMLACDRERDRAAALRWEVEVL